jgi:hypothetical protein
LVLPQYLVNQDRCDVFCSEKANTVYFTLYSRFFDDKECGGLVDELIWLDSLEPQIEAMQIMWSALPLPPLLSCAVLAQYCPGPANTFSSVCLSYASTHTYTNIQTSSILFSNPPPSSALSLLRLLRDLSLSWMLLLVLFNKHYLPSLLFVRDSDATLSLDALVFLNELPYPAFGLSVIYRRQTQKNVCAPQITLGVSCHLHFLFLFSVASIKCRQVPVGVSITGQYAGARCLTGTKKSRRSGAHMLRPHGAQSQLAVGGTRAAAARRCPLAMAGSG